MAATEGPGTNGFPRPPAVPPRSQPRKGSGAREGTGSKKRGRKAHRRRAQLIYKTQGFRRSRGQDQSDQRSGGKKQRNDQPGIAV
jgi:hypothetical protein